MFQGSSSCSWHNSRASRGGEGNGTGPAPAHGAAAGLPLPPDGRGAHHPLPRPEGRRPALRRARRQRGRPQQERALGAAIASEDGGEGVVLLLPQGPQVPDGAANEQGHGGRILEGHGQGQGHLQGKGAGRIQEDARLLHGAGAQGREVRLGHARVPPPRQDHQRRPHQGCFQERVGAVQGVQEEPGRIGATTGGSSQEGRRRDGQDGRHGPGSPPPPADGHVRRRHREPRGGARDLLLQRAGGPVLQQHGATATTRTRRRQRQGPSRPRLFLLPVLRAVRAAAAGHEPGATAREQRVRRPRRRRGGQAARAGAAERVAGHRANVRREPRDLLRPEIRPGPALGLLMIERALFTPQRPRRTLTAASISTVYRSRPWSIICSCGCRLLCDCGCN